MRITADVAIIGGGVIGLTLALELSRRNRRVCVLDRHDFGREASWAGAGMLPPGDLETAKSPFDKLRGLSHDLWPELAERLHESTGTDTGYFRCGTLLLSVTTNERKLFPAGVRAEQCSQSELQKLVPGLSQEFQSATYVPDQSQVRNPRHLKALLAACRSAGVELLPHTEVTGFETGASGQVSGLKTESDQISADQYCVTGGAWTGNLLNAVGVELPIKPIRGQIALLKLPERPFVPCIEDGSRYLVPRADGRVLVGSTQEDVGFDKSNTREAIDDLLQWAFATFPGLSAAEVEQTWAGLRPGSPDGLPFLDCIPDFENLFVAAGHFRDGLQKSPGTALLMSQLLLGEETAIPMDGYRIGRFDETGD
ncbi:glycine oxidase ThiO [Calycomorphotria hydatis]|uniref:Hydrogen cyanide synthase subunit HcnC n=1 Tax=Calycomorphotria hydatis TaxID=2528027 RepID=A0A517TCB3_9PLAN|nr:glycine oxidase ThiO [Calycomorphotria hydatis]QDT66025.1 Hydrogen cyanide synthase subunit HcnC precursor [Calycomorphotria hydatis]